MNDTKKKRKVARISFTPEEAEMLHEALRLAHKHDHTVSAPTTEEENNSRKERLMTFHKALVKINRGLAKLEEGHD